MAATVIAACGSGSHDSTHSSGSHGRQSFARMQQDAVNFARCVRSHDVPGFPDPTTSPRGFKMALDPSVRHSPAFTSAETACQHLLPGGGPGEQSTVQSQRQIAGMLAFARCLRAHGFPRFPDPTHTGELTHQMVAAAGIDIHQPAVRQAADACAGASHGVVTMANIARFIAGH